MDHHRIFDLFKVVSSTASGEHLYDFLGSATRASYKRAWVKNPHSAGKVLKPGLPAVNEHYFDWIATLTAVARAKGTFRMAELGAGWAPWLVRGALAANQRYAIEGVELLALEADTVHFNWIKEHFAENGLDPNQHFVLHGAASGQGGMLSFPVIADPDIDYGASLRHVKAGVPSIEVRAYTIPEILAFFSGPLDFLHVDIQASEYDTLPPAMADLKKGVKSIMIGTHTSAALHDGLARKFHESGWLEVMNYPRSQISVTPYGEVKFDDGVLLFDNPEFW